MAFKFLTKSTKKPTHQGLKCWLFNCIIISEIALLIPFSLSQAMDLKEIEQQVDYYTNMYMFGVDFNLKRTKYLTVSGVSGKKLYIPKSKPEVFFSSYAEPIRFNMLTYPQFYEVSNEIKPKIKYLKLLSRKISTYMKLLDIKPISLTVNYTIISNNNKIFNVSQWMPIKSSIDLTFYDNIHSDQLDNFSKYVEKHLIETLPHELFHFFIGYQNQYRISEIREEVYAHLFGKCVAYEIYPQISYAMDQMKFSNEYFIKPKKDLKKLRKDMKKKKYFTSRIAEVIALYYFQVIAKNYSGVNIHSDNISKFCHKLFSEHNFKYPIEKKPPVWFKRFLAYAQHG